MAIDSRTDRESRDCISGKSGVADLRGICDCAVAVTRLVCMSIATT